MYQKQFKNHCGVIKKHTGLNYFWSVNNSEEFINKIAHVKYADSIETFDFSTLKTKLPLDSKYSSLETLILKMYKNSGSHSMMVNAERKKAFWCHGADYAGYKTYTVDQLLAALKFILYNNYV